MKLKQRVIMVASLTGTLTVLFILGMQLAAPVPGPENEGGSKGGEKPRSVTENPGTDELKVREGDFDSWAGIGDKPKLIVDGDRRELRAPMALPGGLDLRNVPRRFHPRVDENVDFPNRPRPNGVGGRPADMSEILKDLQFSDRRGDRGNPLDRRLSEQLPNRQENDRVSPSDDKKDPWVIWQRWVRQDSLYPEGVFWSDEMDLILRSMATMPVTEFGVGYKGTQLKASMFLGPERQRTSFKPMRYIRCSVYVGVFIYSG